MILTREQLAVERAASLERTRPQREAAEARVREILKNKSVAAANVGWPYRMRAPARQRTCKRCGQDWSEVPKQGAPPKYCPRCRTRAA